MGAFSSALAGISTSAIAEASLSTGMSGTKRTGVTIHYQDGRTEEEIILRFSQDVVRLAVRGEEETVIFKKVGDSWVSDNSEAVRLTLGRPKAAFPTTFLEQQFICSPFLAAHLVGLLRAPRRENG